MTQQQLNPQADLLLQRIDDLEQRLNSARTELESAAQLRTLGLLAGAIAHEFNNILTPVLSYARVALDQPEDQALSQKALSKAADGVERATRLAVSVLNLAGRPADPDAPPRCDPREALVAALECLDRPLPDRNIELSTSIEPGVELAIQATDLEHVLINLLLNSARALGDGGGAIVVSCRGATADECSTWNTPTPAAILELRDNGPGIEPGMLPSLFEPFKKNSAPTDRRGHGLGLAICRHLIQSAGGSIGIRRDVESGAAFVIVLPRAAEQPAAATNAAA